MREQKVLTGPEVSHGGPRSVRTRAQLIDYLGQTHTKYII